jgi:hypothetical protein
MGAHQNDADRDDGGDARSGDEWNEPSAPPVRRGRVGHIQLTGAYPPKLRRLHLSLEADGLRYLPATI